MLTDPLGRVIGDKAQGEVVPDSKYGEVVEIPKMPEHSRSLAIEICNAEQGRYEVKVGESGNEAYRLTVSGIGTAENSESLLLHHIAKDGATRRYAFTFSIRGSKLVLRWLDAEGQEQQRIENNEW